MSIKRLFHLGKYELIKKGSKWYLFDYSGTKKKVIASRKSPKKYDANDIKSWILKKINQKTDSLNKRMDILSKKLTKVHDKWYDLFHLESEMLKEKKNG